jgi:ABC-type transport system involved in multi-copper enzyme maturation permease subunit
MDALLPRLSAVRHIAANAYRESVRDRALYTVLGFAVLLIGATYLLGELTAGQDVKIIKDLGLAAIATFGLFIALFMGIGLVSRDVERRSVYGVLSKPVHRHEFIVGKFAGLAVTLLIDVLVMTVVFYAVLAYVGAQFTESVRAGWEAPAADPAMLCAIGLIFVELLLVTAIALFFSTFAGPFVSAALTFGLWVIGHFSDELLRFGGVVDSQLAAAVARAAYYVLPDFSAFDVKAEVVHAVPVPGPYIATTALYGATYITLLLIAGSVVFGRRDLT